MRSLSLHPGVWSTFLGLCFTGFITILSAPSDEVVLIYVGRLAIAAGIILAAWGIKIRGRPWWRRPQRSLKNLSRTERGFRLVESLRVARGSDPLPYLAHIEFLSSAQRGLAIELDSKFQSSGWKTNPGSVPVDRSSQRYTEGIEVSGFNAHLVNMVSEILNALGFGPAKTLIKTLEITADNPKWDGAQRTVYLFLGHPPPNEPT